jgi:hypothetical protein
MQGLQPWYVGTSGITGGIMLAIIGTSIRMLCVLLDCQKLFYTALSDRLCHILHIPTDTLPDTVVEFLPVVSGLLYNRPEVLWAWELVCGSPDLF